MITNPSTIRSILRVFAAAAVAIAMATSAQAQSTWTGATNSTWNDATNWAGGVPNSTSGTAVFTSTATRTTVTDSGRRDARRIEFQSGALGYTFNNNVGITNGGSVIVNSGVSTNQTFTANVRPVGATAAITNNGSGLLNITTVLSGFANTTTFGGSGNITVGSIQDGISTQITSIVKVGSGTLTINSGNAAAATPTVAGYYGGSTTINGGVLQLGNALSIGGGSSGTAAITFGGGTLRYGSAAVDYSSRIRSSASAIAIDTGTVAAVTFASALDSTNTGGLTKSGTGTLTLSASNAYTGATSVNAGTLAFDRVSALNSSSGVNVAAGAILDYTGGAGTLSRNVTVSSSGTGTIRNSGGQTLTLSGTLTKDGRVLRLTGGTFDVTGQIVGVSNNSDLLVDGTSTVTLSSANTYNGPTFVNQASTLIVGINNAIPSNSTVTLGDATSRGTLDLGTFTNQIGGLVFSGSGGTVRMAANQTTSPQLSTSSALTLGSNASLDLTGMGTTAGNYRLISSTGITGTFGSVTALDSNYILRYGTVNTNEISAQRKAEFGTVAATPAAVSIITGGSTAFSYTVVNATPTNGSTLSFSSANGANVAGASNGTAIAGGTSASISGLVFTGTSVGLGQTGSFTLTDPDAIGTTANGSVTVNVLDHATSSLAGTLLTSTTISLGTWNYATNNWDSGGASGLFSIFNLASPFGANVTADLALLSVSGSGNGFTTNLNTFTDIAGGTSQQYSISVDPSSFSTSGVQSWTFTLGMSDKTSLSGAAASNTLSVTANVVVVPEPGAIALAAIGIAAAAWARRRSR